MALTRITGEGLGSLGTGNLTHGSDSGDTRFTLNSANQYTLVLKNAGNIAGQIGGSGSDVLRFSNAAGATIMEMNAGQITKPLQPAFLVQASGQTNLALNATTTITFGTPIFDQNSDFDASTFTAPVTGKYQLSFCLRCDSVDNTTQYTSPELVTSNRTIPFIYTNNGFDADLDYFTFSGSHLVDMDAGDTAQMKVYLPSLGTAQLDIIGSFSFFSGFLVC